MKNSIKYIIISLFIILLVSCNMDSADGLFEEAAKSTKSNSYTIYSVIGKTSDSTDYLVSSSDGFFFLNSSSTKVSTGEKAKYALTADITSSTSWKVYYYDESAGKFYTVDQNGDTEEVSALGDYQLKSSVYDMAENKYAAVFTKDDDGQCKWYIAYGSSSDLTSTSPSTSVNYTNVSYIGGGTFIGENSNGKEFYFTTTETTGTETSNKFRTHFGNYYITSGDAVYTSSSSSTSSIGSVTGNVYSFTNVYKSGDTDPTYYIAPIGASYVYKISGSSVSSLSCSALANVEVRAIIKVIENKYINVITASGGKQCINISDSTVDDGWK